MENNDFINCNNLDNNNLINKINMLNISNRQLKRVLCQNKILFERLKSEKIKYEKEIDNLKNQLNNKNKIFMIKNK